MLIIQKSVLWEQHHQLAFVTIVRFYHLQQINQVLNSRLSEVVTGYNIKINLAT